MSNWASFAGLVTLGVAFIVAMAKFSRWSGQVDMDRSNFKEFMDRVEKKLDAISDRFPPKPVAGDSPVRLTAIGEQAAKPTATYARAASVAPDSLDECGGSAGEYTIPVLMRVTSAKDAQ